MSEPKTNRFIGHHHLSFWRGHLEGLDLSFLGERYLETGNDRVRAKATLRWIRSELVAAAHRQSRHAIARLLRVPIEKLSEKNDNPPPQMTLEEFQAQRDPDWFYTEAELIELFEQEVGNTHPVAARKFARNNRLRKRLRDATTWLESFLCVDPTPSDHVGAWLDESVASRLTAAGVSTLEDLLALIRKRGASWHKKVSKLGPTGAKRLESWLIARHLLTSKNLPSPVRQTTLATGVYPLERFRPPEELSGATGSNRAYGTAMAASDDRAAIETWLSSIGPKPHTLRSYRKEAERFLLWCIFEKQKAMSSVTVEDCADYRNFLTNIGRPDDLWFWQTPQSTWVGPHNVPRWSEDWKPFSGPLALTSQRLSVTILTILFEYLMRQCYLQTNPWDGVSPILSSAPTIRKDHSLSPDQWKAVMASLDEYEVRDEAWYRVRFALLLGYMSGLRMDEMARATVAKHAVGPGESNPGLKPAEDGDGWDLEVIGKGLKTRSVPMANAVMDALSDYMEVRGHGRDPGAWREGLVLISTLPHGMQYAKTERSSMSWSAISRMFKLHFRKAAILMESARDAGHLMQASTHWLRHTHATHALAAGAAIQDVQENLGHASPATTAIYSHAGRKRRKAAVERLQAQTTKSTDSCGNR